MKNKLKHFFFWHINTIIGLSLLSIAIYLYEKDHSWMIPFASGLYVLCRRPYREIICRKLTLSDTSGNVGIELYAQGFQNRLRIYQPPEPGAEWHPRGIELIADEKGNRLLVCTCEEEEDAGYSAIKLEATKRGEYNLFVADD